MKAVIDTVKKEIARLKPYVDEYENLNNLLLQLQAGHKFKKNFAEGTKNGGGRYKNLKNGKAIKITEHMPEKFLIKYGFSVGDFWRTRNDMIQQTGFSDATIAGWVKKGYCVSFDLED